MDDRQPTHEDIINIVYRMYAKDGISKDEVTYVVDTFPNQGDFSCHFIVVACAYPNNYFLYGA